MRFLSIAVAAAWTAACCSMVVADPYRLLAPDDPAFRSGWRPPVSPTGDLKAYQPVDAGNWLASGTSGGAAATPGPSGMSGMKGMTGMPGMEPGK